MNLFRGIFIALHLFSPLLLAVEREDPSIPLTSCVSNDSWRVPGEIGNISEASVLAQAIVNQVVLLGEHHDNQSHHDWQLRMLQALHQQRSDIAIGLEMLPKEAQPQIDRFLRGESNIETFLKAVDWKRHWSFSADYYTPLLNYARAQKIPVYALNVTRDKVEAAVERGWEAVPQGMTRPAAASRSYLRHLVMSFQRHKFPAARLDMAVEGPVFRRFVQKQLLWDRAMAEGISAPLDATQKSPLMIAFIGSGHLMHGYGVPHQLQSLGIDKVMTMIPWDRHLDCRVLEEGFADVVYGTE